MSDINTPLDGDAVEQDPKHPPEEASSYNIQPPPTDGADPAGVPDEDDSAASIDEHPETGGVPDAGTAIDGGTEGAPGANATGVGA